MKNELIALILQNIVLYPNQEIKLEFNNKQSESIIFESIKKYASEILIISPIDELEIRPNIDDLPEIATIAQIKSNITLPNGKERVTLRGIKRIHIKKYIMDEYYIKATFDQIKPIPYNMEEENIYLKKIKKLTKEYVNKSDEMSNSILEIIKNVTNLSKLTDIISATIDISYKEKLELLKETNYYKRAKKLINILNSELSSLEFDKKIDDEIRESFNKKERDILIKEKIDILNKELGVDNNLNKECNEYYKRINQFKIDPKLKNNLKEEVEKLSRTSESSPEFSVIRSHLEFITSLPWSKETVDNKNIKEIDKNLNETHYGLDKAKDRIEEYLALKQTNSDLHSPILCLVGPPGTGKTTFARELAKSIGREFIKVSVGGLNDSAELIGHRRTYIGAGPGKIMEGIKKSSVNNPIILIDEVDKMVKDYKGDPASVMLEILDQNQNKEFQDNYVGMPFDLSNVLFILTANDINNIPSPLLDRLEVIDVHSYTMFDKVEITKNYTLPRLGKEYRFNYKNLIISDRVIIKIVNEYTKEAGVRDLERQIATIIRKNLIKNGLNKPITIKENDIKFYLGNNKYTNYKNDYNGTGIVNVPAITNTGGCVLNIECAIYEGNNKVITTGSLGDIMKESILISTSYIKSNAKYFKIDTKKLSGTIHVHVLDATSKKDGPSAGLAITTALMSLLLNKKIPNDIAFTGEISLEGRILMVGGIKEKIISCYNSGIKKIFIPVENIGDLDNIPKKVLNNINIVPINNFKEAYEQVFNI